MAKKKLADKPPDGLRPFLAHEREDGGLCFWCTGTAKDAGHHLVDGECPVRLRTALDIAHKEGAKYAAQVAEYQAQRPKDAGHHLVDGECPVRLRMELKPYGILQTLPATSAPEGRLIRPSDSWGGARQW